MTTAEADRLLSEVAASTVGLLLFAAVFLLGLALLGIVSRW